jgi:hypothetical protein
MHKVGPAAALVFQDLLSRGCELIVASSALSRLLDPSPYDEAPLFEPIEQRIKRGDIELEQTFRALFDELADLVTVAWAMLD